MSSNHVVIVDYGIGNLHSVASAIEYCEGKVGFARTPDQIRLASKIILPGVGAFGRAAERLKKFELIHQIIDAAHNGVPILGICLGMQLLFDTSEEFGSSKGLGLIPGKVVKIPQIGIDGSTLKLPHIGWSKILPSIEGKMRYGSLLTNITETDTFYFLHSYMVEPKDSSIYVGFSKYEHLVIPAYVESGNIFGCQFHPEKSGKSGLKVIKQFLKI